MANHCCERMSDDLAHKCDVHPDPFDCPDNLIYYSETYREYGIIVHDGGSSSVQIHFCPWCGCKLPDSLREKWFDMLEGLGKEPGDADIPAKYHSDQWWKELSL